jgi:hypothetical protein
MKGNVMRNRNLRKALRVIQWPSNENGNLGIMADGRTFHYDAAHNGFVYDSGVSRNA